MDEFLPNPDSAGWWVCWTPLGHPEVYEVVRRGSKALFICCGYRDLPVTGSPAGLWAKLTQPSSCSEKKGAKP